MDKRVEKIQGVFPALYTFFRDDGSINDEALAQLIEMDIKKGVSGFYVTGSTGAAFMMSVEERKHVLKKVAEIVNGRVALIAQNGDISTDHAVELSQYAESLGYDAVSAVTPFYYKVGYDDMKQYYKDIASSVKIPLIVYYIPILSGTSFSLDQMSSIVDLDNVGGIKFTAPDLYMLERLRSRFPEKTIMFGTDEMFIEGILAGSNGGIGSTYNFMAEKYVKLQKLINSGKVDEARKLQSECNFVLETLIANGGCTQASKALLGLMGIDVGHCHRPLHDVSPENLAVIKEKVLPLMEY